MLRDIEKNGPIEADHILGFIFAKAAVHKVDSLLHRFIYTHLQSYEVRRATNAANVAALKAAS
jgi:2-dehydropantoate 2-reductase